MEVWQMHVRVVSAWYFLLLSLGAASEHYTRHPTYTPPSSTASPTPLQNTSSTTSTLTTFASSIQGSTGSMIRQLSEEDVNIIYETQVVREITESTTPVTQTKGVYGVAEMLKKKIQYNVK